MTALLFQSVNIHCLSNLKVRLSPSKKVVFICLNKSPLKMMKIAFCFILKAVFILEILTFLS